MQIVPVVDDSVFVAGRLCCIGMEFLRFQKDFEHVRLSRLLVVWILLALRLGLQYRLVLGIDRRVGFLECVVGVAVVAVAVIADNL